MVGYLRSLQRKSLAGMVGVKGNLKNLQRESVAVGEGHSRNLQKKSLVVMVGVERCWMFGRLGWVLPWVQFLLAGL